MNDNFFNTLIGSLIAAGAILAASAQIRAVEPPAAQREASLASQEIVTLPTVMVTGHRSPEAALAAGAADNKVAVADASGH